MTTATTNNTSLNLAPSGLAPPPRRPRFRPKVTPACPHCDRLGPVAYSVHVGGLCVRLVADHTDQVEVVAGVTMRPVELTVNGDHRWLWTRTDVDAMDVDDLVVMFQAFEPNQPQAPNRVVDGGSAGRPEAVSLFQPPAVEPAATPAVEPAANANFSAGGKNPAPPVVPVGNAPTLPLPAWV